MVVFLKSPVWMTHSGTLLGVAIAKTTRPLSCHHEPQTRAVCVFTVVEYSENGIAIVLLSADLTGTLFSISESISVECRAISEDLSVFQNSILPSGILHNTLERCFLPVILLKNYAT